MEQDNTKIATKQMLIDAFCLIYQHKPIEKITVTEICKKAGYDRTTFYQYFFNISDVLEEVENELLRLFKKRRAADTSDRKDFVLDLVSLYDEKQLYFDALFGDYGDYRFLDKIKGQIQYNRISDDKMQPYLIEYHFYTATMLFRLWLRRGKDITVEQLFSEITKLYDNGVSSLDIFE